MTDREFNEGLQRHLMRCERNTEPENAPKGSEVDWLAPHCGTVQEIARFLPGAWDSESRKYRIVPTVRGQSSIG